MIYLVLLSRRSLKCITGILFTILVSYCCHGQEVRMEVDVSREAKHISKGIYGSCIEDVNHEIYGGLYNQRLFGESFEEPQPSLQLEGWKTLGGYWNLVGQTVEVMSGPGFKAVKTDPVFKDGRVDADIKLEGGVNGGLLVRVKNAGIGADQFDGYEVSLNYQTQELILGKHRQNWQPLTTAAFSFAKGQWIHLAILLEGARVRVFTGQKSSPLIDYTDNHNALPAGRIALRTYNGDVSFKNIVVRESGKTAYVHFTADHTEAVSAAWSAINTDGKGSFQLDRHEAYNGRQSQVVMRHSAGGKTGAANSGLNRWGIAVKQGQRFTGRVYLRSENLQGKAVVAIQSADGRKTYAEQTLPRTNSGWEKYSFQLVSDANDPGARFAIYIDQPGKLWMDQAVLMPVADDRFTKLGLRADIATKMQQEGLTFLRYGGSMVNAPEYRWENMTGDPDKRPPYKGTWYPYSTNAFGIEEFLKFCEAANFEPAFAINIEESPETVYDMVRYLNDDAGTKQGKRRADNGHPEPYHVKYIEIGNEEVIQADDRGQYDHYIKRFLLLHQAIRRADPSVQLINAAWWRPESSNMERIFHALDGKAAYWDLHVWADDPASGKKVDSLLGQMQSLFLRWNPQTNMKCAIFEENGNMHNLQRALGHASVLNAVRRHADFVLTSCAANALQPMGQNDNGWDQGQIFFTPSQVWGMPPFYAQQMAVEHHQPVLVSDHVEGPLDVTATRSTDGKTLVIHVVNPGGQRLPADIFLKGITGMASQAAVYTLSGPLDAVNTAKTPEQVITHKKRAPVDKDRMQFDFEPYSYTIIELEIRL